MRKREGISSLSVFFTTLAVSDICVLYAGLLPVYIEYQFQISFMNASQVQYIFSTCVCVFVRVCTSGSIIMCMCVSVSAEPLFQRSLKTTGLQKKSKVKTLMQNPCFRNGYLRFGHGHIIITLHD